VTKLAVETRAGIVRGELRPPVSIWRGIPYAAPPIGDLRFRPPQRVTPWTGERDATKFGTVAAQSRDPAIAMMSGIGDKIVSGEDCLTLNVFSPGADHAKRPVMVWIHGGAFIMGSGSTPLYHGDSFAAQHDIVVVTLNYRLGFFGLLYLGDLAPGREAGNYALLDQIEALRWVRDNIAAFGGDPDNVTVMGESAGAISIGSLLGMPAARGLFHRAILQSGATVLSPPTREDMTNVARNVLADLGVTVGELPDVPEAKFLALQEKLAREKGLAAFSPYVDGVTVPEPPINAVRAGAIANIPLLLGTNRDEWTLFEVFLGDRTITPFEAPLRARIGTTVDELLAIYARERPGRTERQAWIDLIGDVAFRFPAIQLAEAQSDHQRAVYMYRFDWASPAINGRLGAAHGLDLPFVWNRVDLPASKFLLGEAAESAQPLATMIHATWAAFIRAGDPNGGGLPAWPTYDRTRRQTMLIDRTCSVVEDPGGVARALFPAL